MNKRFIRNLIFCSIFLLSPVFASETQIASEQKLAVGVTPTHSEFRIKLISNPATGYSWFLKKFDKDMIASVQHHFKASQAKTLIGAPGEDEWSIKLKPAAFVVPQTTGLTFVYARPWEVDTNAKTLNFTIFTAEK